MKRNNIKLNDTINLHQMRGATSTTYNIRSDTTVNRGKNWTNTRYNSTGTDVKTTVKRNKK